MFTSHKQISPPSLVLKLKISEVSQKWIPKAVELKRIPTHKKCKCKKFCSQTRLVGEIYSSDVIMHRGYYRLHCTLLLIFFKIEDKGFKWQSGFTPVTLTRNLERFVLKRKKNILGKVSGKFETFGNKVLICFYIFPESLWWSSWEG